MLGNMGIGGRLFLAFSAIMALSLVSGLVGWLELRQVAGTQASLTRDTVPAAMNARGVAEASSRLIAAAPLLTGASTEQQRQREAAALFAQAKELRALLATLKRHDFASDQLGSLEAAVEGLLDNLERQNDLVARRLALASRAQALVTRALGAAIGLSDLSETLVANAASGTTAVISSLYDLVEDNDKIEATLQALDRLVENDVYLMERMFELRLRSSQTGLQLNQLNNAGDLEEIEALEAALTHNLQILARRVNSIADPVRKVQARAYYADLVAANGAVQDNNVFQLRRAILSTGTQIDDLARENQAVSADLGGLVEALVAASQMRTAAAGDHAERSVRIGLATLLGLTTTALVAAALILWFYVRRRVIDRLISLAAVMGELARGNLNVAVETSGHDELTHMAKTIEFFKQEAVKKRELELERERTEVELRRHKTELEALVHERTQQLSDANARLTQEVVSHDAARDRAEAASRAKSEFLATMSHEIRTPMNGMLGMLRLLGKAELGDREREQLLLVQSSGEALLTILNDILDYSKIESGHIDLEETAFDLEELVNGILSLLRPRAQDKDVGLTLTCSAEVPRLLRGDPGKLRQILFNLIGNGLKFTERGQVAVGIEGLEAGTEGHCRLRFEIADNGIGLAPTDREKVFDAFFQKDASISRRYGGTGLGLAICKKLVEAMGGEIGLDDRLQGGSIFWFTLTLAIARPEEISEQNRMLAADGKGATTLPPKRILVVEDNEISSLVTRAFLEDQGHSVTMAKDGLEALDAVSAGNFDAVLMDISLPGMDGIEATGRIRTLADTDKRHIPIIAISAHVFSSEIDQHLSAGMNGFIGKPVSPERLSAVLSQVLANDGKAPREPIVVTLPEAADGHDDQARIARDSLAQDLKVLGARRTGKLVDLFLKTAPKNLRDIGQAVADADYEGACFAAHKLKSSAGSLGLVGLAGHSEALEAAARAGSEADLSELLDGLEGLYQETSRLLTDTWQSLSS